MYEVIASNHFWRTANGIRSKYTREQFIEILGIVKEAIDELAEKGHVETAGWNDHLLVRRPYADGNHFEFHIFDDDVLVVYFKHERHRRIRMVGIYDHDTLA